MAVPVKFGAANRILGPADRQKETLIGYLAVHSVKQ